MASLTYVVRRLALAAPLLLGMSVLVFGLMRVIPGDPAVVVLGYKATPESIHAMRESFHLDEPLPQQYVRWLGGVLHGDFGIDFRQNEPRGGAGTAHPRRGAGRRAPPVRAVRARQGTGRARHPRPARAAQRRHPDRDGDRPPGRLHARRRDRRRDDLHAAGTRADDARRGAGAELPGGAERAPGRRGDVHGRESPDRRALRPHRPAAPAALRPHGTSPVAVTGFAIVVMLAVLA